MRFSGIRKKSWKGFWICTSICLLFPATGMALVEGTLNKLIFVLVAGLILLYNVKHLIPDDISNEEKGDDDMEIISRLEHKGWSRNHTFGDTFFVMSKGAKRIVVDSDNGRLVTRYHMGR